MATNFPTSLDALTNPTSGQTLNSPSHSTQHANSNDAIEALQAKVGVNSSAVTTSLDYIVRNLSAANITSGTLPSARLAGITSLSLSTGAGAIIKSTEQRLVSGTNQSAGLYMGDGATGNVATGGIEVSWNTSNTNPTIGIGVTRDSIGTKITMDYAGQLRFFSTGSEVLSIGATTANFANTVAAPTGNFTNANLDTTTLQSNVNVMANGIRYYGSTIGGGSVNSIGFRWANPYVMVTVDNSITTDCAFFSDRRIKTNIQTLDNGIELIRGLRSVTFNPLDVIGFDDATHEPIVGDKEPYDEMIGFIADEVAIVYPKAVRGEGNRLKSIDTVQLLSMAVSAIQTLDQRLSELESA